MYRLLCNDEGLTTTLCPNFFSMASPQPDKVRWMDLVERAFRALKEALTSSRVMKNHNFDRPFLVQTDTLKMGLGTVLSQEFE